jgi:subtilisin family serine protease
MKMHSKSIAVVTLATLGLSLNVKAQEAWMSPEVGVAWGQGYRGQNVRLNVVDNFNYSFTSRMNHGAATLWQSQAVAPGATVVGHTSFAGVVGIVPNTLNVFNLSYGAFSNSTTGRFDSSNAAIIGYAQRGQAVIVKSAGNDSIPVGGFNVSGEIDMLAVALAGQQSAILVGALSRNGTPENRANLASYSNSSGTSPVVQKNFLVVGVESAKLGGLSGTSFAAPIVSGYAAILGSKFTTATPNAVANQLLNTARTDTINGYNPNVHGRGEASITRALAPASIR